MLSPQRHLLEIPLTKSLVIYLKEHIHKIHFFFSILDTYVSSLLLNMPFYSFYTPTLTHTHFFLHLSIVILLFLFFYYALTSLIKFSNSLYVSVLTQLCEKQRCLTYLWISVQPPLLPSVPSSDSGP